MMSQEKKLRESGMHGSTTRLELKACPVCYGKLDAASAIEGDTIPKEGDLTLCGHCSAILVFDAELNRSIASQELLDSLSPEEKDGLKLARIIILKANIR